MVCLPLLTISNWMLWVATPAEPMHYLVVGHPGIINPPQVPLADLILCTKATNGLYTGGGVIGCLFVPTLLDAFGRKRTIQITTVLCVLSAALQTGSVHIAMLLVARFLNGIGVGMINVTVPIYQSEISPAKMRGRMVGSHGFLLCVGYVSETLLLLDKKASVIGEG